MILPEVILPSRANQHWTQSGLDSLNTCVSKQCFMSYPQPVKYDYNSRGFRDAEWPNILSDLKNAIWVFGDSFTVGIGSASEHIWPHAVAQKLNKRVINISMDGASNQWIARHVLAVHQEVQPDNMITMWSYFHRRESADITKSDEDRRMFVAGGRTHSHADDIDNFSQCVNQVRMLPANCIHFVIPRADPVVYFADIWREFRGADWPEHMPETATEYQQLPDGVRDEIQHAMRVNRQFNHAVQFTKIFSKSTQFTGNHHYCGPVPQLDTARDGHHFDVLSSQWVATMVAAEWGFGQ